MNLRDDYVVRGSDIRSFNEEIEKFTKNSRTMEVRGWEIGLMSFFKKDAKGNYWFQFVDESTINGQKKNADEQRHFIHLKPEEVDKNLIDEIMQTDNPGLLLFLANRCYYFSAGAIGTLAQRAGVACSWLGKKSIAKTEMLVEGLCMNERACNLVIHRDQAFKANNEPAVIEKVFSVMGSHYQPVPMTVISGAADKILSNTSVGLAKVRDWEISHRFSRITIEFPEEAEAAQKAYGLPDMLIPGVILQNSDTGDCSVTAYGTFRVAGASYPVIYDEALTRAHIIPKNDKEHADSMTADALIQAIDENLLKDLRVLPKALAEKQNTLVYDFDPRKVVIAPGRKTMPKEYRENLDAVSDLIKKWAKDLHLVSIIGKKRTKELVDGMIAEIDPSQVYTEYDIALDFMKISDRIFGISQALRDNLAKQCKEAPFLKGSKKAKEKKIVLTPAV